MPAVKRKPAARSRAKTLVVCIKNDGYSASLEKRKIYIAVPDAAAERRALVRVVDESGESYLYPKACFRPLDLPKPTKKAVLAAA